jgi:hypothetical protein
MGQDLMGIGAGGLTEVDSAKRDAINGTNRVAQAVVSALPQGLDDGYAERKRIADALNPPRLPLPTATGGLAGSKAYDPLSSIRAAPGTPTIVNNVQPQPTPVHVQVYVNDELSQDFRVTGSSYEHDGRMGFAGPDVRN